MLLLQQTVPFVRTWYRTHPYDTAHFLSVELNESSRRTVEASSPRGDLRCNCVKIPLLLFPIVPAGMSASTSSSSSDLSSLYRQISDQAVRTLNWPASSDFIRLLDSSSSSSGIYKAPTFSDGNGPIALVSLFSETDNSAAVPLIQACLAQFDAFVDELCRSMDITSSQQQQQQQQQLHIVPAKVPHICIIVFQEHPSLLSNEQQTQPSHWRPVDDAVTVPQLAADLSVTLLCHNTAAAATSMEAAAAGPIWLTLDSLLLTPDGAMIAGFVEQQNDFGADTDDSHHCYYRRMKDACADTARACLGTELTSRPKQLIHVTLGRFLGFRENDDDATAAAAAMGGDNDDNNNNNNDQFIARAGPLLRKQRQLQLQELVRSYNQERLPAFVASRKDRTWRLQHVSLLRNTVWLCEENIIYKTWDLTELPQKEQQSEVMND